MTIFIVILQFISTSIYCDGCGLPTYIKRLYDLIWQENK